MPWWMNGVVKIYHNILPGLFEAINEKGSQQQDDACEADCRLVGGQGMPQDKLKGVNPDKRRLEQGKLDEISLEKAMTSHPKSLVK